MKSRYRKHIARLIKNSPLIGFSQEETLNKNEIISQHQFNKMTQHIGLEKTGDVGVKFKNYKKDMYSNLALMIDHYILTGGHHFIYLLKPSNDKTYKVVEKESLKDWRERYWSLEDPNNERDWCFYDEDTADLYLFIMDSFDRATKLKISKFRK